MQVTVKVTEQYSDSRGKSQTYQSQFFDISVGRSYLSITGASSHGRGTGTRGGDPKYYDNEVTIRLSQPDLKQIVSAALTENFITLDSPDKVKIEKARQYLVEAMKILSD